MKRIQDGIKIKLDSPWGNSTQRRIVGKITGIVYGMKKSGDIFTVDKSDQLNEPDYFCVIEEPKKVAPKKRRTRRKTKAVNNG